MKSAWVEREAKTSGRPLPQGRHRPRTGAARLFDAPARPRPQTGAARRRQQLAEDAGTRSRRRQGRRAARQGLGRRHGRGRAAGLSRRAARAVARLARAQSPVRRRDGAGAARLPDRSAGALAFGRDAAARLHAGEIHRPHPRHRGAQPDRPARRARAVRGGLSAGGSASCPIACRASGSPKRPPRCSTTTQKSKA